MYSFHAMIPIEPTTIVWASVVSLCFFAYCSCDDAAFNTKFSTISGHVKSTTPAMQPELFVNHSSHVIATNHQPLSNLTSQNNRSGKRIFIRSGNELWDGLIDDCLYKPSFSCFQKNIYTYLDSTLKLADVNVTERIRFKKIDIDPNLLAQLQNNTEEHDNEIPEEETREFKSGSISMTCIFYFRIHFLRLIFQFIFRITNRRSHRRTLWKVEKFHDDTQFGIENARNAFRRSYVSHHTSCIRGRWCTY